MEKNTVILPIGALGGVDGEPELDSLLRQIATKYSTTPTEWTEKYGTDFENDIFMMNRFCWCEKEDCKWCGSENAPNFLHKKTGFEVRWYKYIGRSMEMNKAVPIEKLRELI